MSDGNSQSSQGSSGKTWLGRITQMLQGEPQNREELVEVIADAQERDVIDPETKEMIAPRGLLACLAPQGATWWSGYDRYKQVSRGFEP